MCALPETGNLRWTHDLTYKTETDPQRRRGCQGQGRGGGKDGESGISRCRVFYKWMNIKILLYSTGNHMQYPTINHHGKEYWKSNACVCIAESLCCTAGINTALYINYASIKIIVTVHFEKEKAHRLTDTSRLSSEGCICLPMPGLPWRLRQ